MQTTAIAGTTRGDAQAEASAAKMAASDTTVIHHEAKIPQLPEV
jgi:hypothetical protein